MSFSEQLIKRLKKHRKGAIRNSLGTSNIEEKKFWEGTENGLSLALDYSEGRMEIKNK